LLDGTTTTTHVHIKGNKDLFAGCRLFVSQDGRYIALTKEKQNNMKYLGVLIDRGRESIIKPTNQIEFTELNVKYFPNDQYGFVSEYVDGVFSPFDILGHQGGNPVLYLLDCNGKIDQYSIIDRDDKLFLYDKMKGINQLDTAETYSEYYVSPSKKIGKYSTILCSGHRYPLLTTFWQSETDGNELRFYSISEREYVFTAFCPYLLNSIGMVFHDQLLITVSKRNKMAVTFINYILVCGKPLSMLNVEDYIRIEPLLAIEPNNIQLQIMIDFIEYFSKGAKSKSP
jgi:hypothetical protein